jgi:hypothetical protein
LLEIEQSGSVFDQDVLPGTQAMDFPVPAHPAEEKFGCELDFGNGFLYGREK